MAKPKQTATVHVFTKKNVKRKGVHSKSKTSKLKTSKNYKKSYNSQGKH